MPDVYTIKGSPARHKYCGCGYALVAVKDDEITDIRYFDDIFPYDENILHDEYGEYVYHHLMHRPETQAAMDRLLLSGQVRCGEFAGGEFVGYC